MFNFQTNGLVSNNHRLSGEDLISHDCRRRRPFLSVLINFNFGGLKVGILLLPCFHAVKFHCIWASIFMHIYKKFVLRMIEAGRNGLLLNKSQSLKANYKLSMPSLLLFFGFKSNYLGKLCFRCSLKPKSSKQMIFNLVRRGFKCKMWGCSSI